MSNRTQTTHNLNCSQLAANIFDILRAVLLKIQACGVLPEFSDCLFLRNIGQKCRDTVLLLQVADSCLKCHWFVQQAQTLILVLCVFGSLLAGN